MSVGSSAIPIETNGQFEQLAGSLFDVASPVFRLRWAS